MTSIKDDSLRIIVLENIRELGESAVNHIKRQRKDDNDKYLVPIKQVRFSNGEGKVQLNATVRGKDVFILSDITNYDTYFEMYGRKVFMSPDDHFQDIKRTISAIRGNANRISVIMPFLYQSRQHSRNGRESLDCALALQELERLGIDNIITFDVHDPNVQNAIPLLSFDNFYPTDLMLRAFMEDQKNDFGELDTNNLLVISPDEGAMKRCRFYAAMLEVDIGLFYKRRDYSRIENGTNPIEEHKYLGKEQEGLDYIIVDDMISSGGSIFDILEELKKRKARNIYAMTTFALFTEGIERFDQAYEEGLLAKLYTTKLSYIPEEIKQKPWLRAVNCAEFLAHIIDTYNKQESISPLLNGKKELFEEIRAAKRQDEGPTLTLKQRPSEKK